MRIVTTRFPASTAVAQQPAPPPVAAVAPGAESPPGAGFSGRGCRFCTEGGEVGELGI